MKALRSWFVVLFALAAIEAKALPLTFSFSLLPAGGNVTGAAGEQTGWGYAITNTDDINWFVATSLSAPSFSIGAPDSSIFDFPILAPGETRTQAFDPISGNGLIALEIFPGVPSGSIEEGIYALLGEWWTGDPFLEGELLEEASPATAPFSVQVINGVSEPGVIWLLVAVVPLLTHYGKRRQRSGKLQ